MQNSEHKMAKPNLQGKLRLKRNNSESSQTTLSSNIKCSSESHINIESSSSNNDKSSSAQIASNSLNPEDSLADFKSPKEEKVYKPILNKFKINAEKVKKKLLRSKNKPNIKSGKSTDLNQPSIESSFFKPQTPNQNEIKESVPCPVCLKPFKDDFVCTNHMKTCAAKNNVSVKQLLNAKQLQDRQAEERKAMGLLAAPVLSERKKVYRSKNYSTGDDPQLQLVLAMSESLYEAEQIVELEQAAILAGIPSECIKEMNDEDRRTTLQSFGFTSNKPVSDAPSTKSRKRKLLGPTILQTRSREDKDRVLTERIACILTGDDALTQAQQQTEIITQKNSPTVLRSKILKEIQRSNDKLWDKSRLTKKYDFYVKELKSHFIQSDESLKKDELLNSNFSPDNINNDDDQNTLLNSSIVYEPMDFDIVVNQSNEQKNSYSLDTSESESMNCEINFMKNLVSCWGESLNNSAASDIIIFVKNDKHIFAHKLVFFVQRPSILNDIKSNDSEKYPRIYEKICWLETDQLAALAFLEFIYCGMISKNIDIFDHNDLISEVKQLARLYKVNELTRYLRIKQNELIRLKECKTLKENIVNTDHSSIKDSTNISKISNVRKSSSLVQQSHTKNTIEKFKSDPTPMVNRLVPNNILNKSLKIENDRRITASPDLFESEDEMETIYSCNTQKNNCSERSDNNINLNVLVDLINKDDNINVSSQNIQIHQNENNYEGETMSSQKTVVNLNRTPSPQTNESIILLDQEDIHEAVTPKSRSPERDDNATPEKMDHDFQEIAEAVTPKNLSPGRHIEENVEIKLYKNKEITEAVTLKNRSPERCDNNMLETMNNMNTQVPIAVTPESNTLSTLNDCNISKKEECAVTEDTVTIPNEVIEQEDDSIYNAITPPKSDGKQLDSSETLRQVKLRLDRFIDKVHKENMKSVLASDSEIDSPMPTIKNKIPFLKKNRDDSYAYLRKSDNKQEQRKGLSMLENALIEEEKKSVSNKASKHNEFTTKTLSKTLDSELQDELTEIDNSKLINVSTSSFKGKSQSFTVPSNITKRSYAKNNSKKSINISTSDDEVENITLNESEMSMYSKYKKSNNNDNSIEKYRNELNINLKHTDVDLSKRQNLNNDLTNTKKKNLLQNISVSKPESVIEDITLVSDSDDEEHSHLKIVANSKQVCEKNNTQLEKTNVETKLSSETNIENDSTFPLELVNEFQQSQILTEKSDLLIKKAKNKVIDLSLDSDEEDIHNDSTDLNNLTTESDNSLKNKNNISKNIYSSKNKQKEFLEISEKKNELLDAEISKILQSSPEFINEDENFSKGSNKSKEQERQNQENSKIDDNKNHNRQPEVINLSPISIVSSPEFRENNLPKSNSNNSNKVEKDKFKNNDISNKEDQIESHSIENVCFDEIEFNDEWYSKSPKKSSVQNKNKSFELALNDSSVSKRKLNFEDTSSKNSSSPKSNLISSPELKNLHNSFVSSPILSENKRNKHATQIRSRKRQNESSEELLKKTRKLKKKSASASNFTEFEKTRDLRKDDFQKSNSSVVTPEKYVRSSQTTTHKEDVTPPVDYSVLGTPDLHKHLNKYGIKPQSRSKAKLLLRHIYNEIHPEVPASQKRTYSTNSSSEDEQPPLRKQDVKKSRKKTNSKEKNEQKKTGNSQNCLIIPEEMVYEEPDAANNLGNPVSIKDAFFRLIKTNKELYTKVLTYEPLPLESLHLKLKQTGFKCKINSLMDFLDEQCITFQMQTVKSSRTRKKNK